MGSKKSKCQGVFGWMFGHRFWYLQGEWVCDSNHCRRCGMPQGGWR